MAANSGHEGPSLAIPDVWATRPDAGISTRPFQNRMHTDAHFRANADGRAPIDIAQPPLTADWVARPGAHVAASVPRTLYFPALDGLRFFAFLLVFVHHLPSPANPVLHVLHEHGWIGVHLFLFLSAYLLTSILQAERSATGTISIYNFYVRRALRIWPLYFSFCFGVLVYQLLLHSERGVDWPGFAGLMFFADNILAGLRGYNHLPFAAHLWTISLEEQFYLVLPFLLAGFLGSSRSLLRGILGCWLVFIAVRTVEVLLEARHPLLWTSVFSADALLLGTLLGGVPLRYPERPVARTALVVGGTGALFSAALMPPIQVPGAHQIVVYSFIAIGAAAVTMAALHEPLLGFLKVRPFRYLGKISYGLYVFHLVGIAIGTKVTQTLIGNPPASATWWLTAVVSLAVTIALGTLSYQFFERSFLRLKRNFEAIRSRPA
ncbi:MAG: hypothetical protein JWP08_345 [Bryobacterales bacterium]|nr:hypothetical protein [Bryobacterales bacterium]